MAKNVMYYETSVVNLLTDLTVQALMVLRDLLEIIRFEPQQASKAREMLVLSRSTDILADLNLLNLETGRKQ